MTEPISPPVRQRRAAAAAMPPASGLRKLAKHLLPDPLLRHLRALRALPPEARWTYVRCRFQRMRQRTDTLSGSATPRSVLFICYGNIIRSAMAEQLLRRECPPASGQPPVEVRSAGVRARSGRPADARAIEVAPEFGVSLAGHQAAGLTPELVASADLIIVMDYLNEAELLARFPLLASKVRLMGEYLEEAGSGELEIADPYMEDVAAVRAAFVRIQRGIRRLVSVHGLDPAAILRSGSSASSDRSG